MTKFWLNFSNLEEQDEQRRIGISGFIELLYAVLHTRNLTKVVFSQAFQYSPKCFNILVERLVEKYGDGEVSVSVAQNIHTAGTLVGENGALMVYAVVDDFVCPNCN